MKVTAEELPERQVRLEIEVDEARHNEAIEAAYKKLAPRVQIPGFRPGKAPRPLIEKQLGRHRLLDEAMDQLLPAVYREALDEQKIDPVAQPSVELVSHEPLVFKATVPLQPTVDLGDYKAMRVEKPTVEVTEEEIDNTIEELRRRYGTIEPVDRPAQLGDHVRASIDVEVDGNRIYHQEDQEIQLREDYFALPGMLEAFIGATKGEAIEREAEVDEDFPDERIAGKKAMYKLSVSEIKAENLAEADDAFAQQVGEGFPTIQALRDRIREDTQKSQEDQALRLYETSLVDQLAESATIEYPAVMVEHEVEHILEDQANLDPRDPRAVELYLARMNKTEEEVKESVREEAAQRLRRSLVLSHFAEAENISIEDADVDAEVQTMTASAGEQAEMLANLFNNEAARDSLRRSLLTRRTLERLVAIASDGASEGGETAVVAEEKPARRAAAPKPRRSGPRSAAANEEGPGGQDSAEGEPSEGSGGQTQLESQPTASTEEQEQA